MTALALLIAIGAFMGFGLSSERHGAARLGRRPSADVVRRIRAAAWAALTVAFALSVAARGWIFGPILWSGLIMASAGVAFLFLNLTPPPQNRSH